MYSFIIFRIKREKQNVSNSAPSPLLCKIVSWEDASVIETVKRNCVF